MEGSEGRGEKVRGKEEVANRRGKNRKEERNGGPRNSLGSLPSGLILARSQPSPSFAPFSFSSSLTAVLSTLSSEVRLPPCFSSSACMYTYRLVCVQATFACSDRKRGKERRETD